MPSHPLLLRNDMIIATADQMKKLDEWAISEAGIPRLLLMENAGSAVASNIASAFGKVRNCVILAGKGGNGGDGFVVARRLFASGSTVEVFLLASASELSGETKTNFDILQKLCIKVSEVLDPSSLITLENSLKKCDVAVDAIFGIGFSGEVSGIAAQAIDLINNSKKRVTEKKLYKIVSVDIPSGLNADSGDFGGHCVKADLTVTFTYPKKGLLQFPSMDMVGKLVISDIGIPMTNPLDPVKKDVPGSAQIKWGELDVITPEYVANKIPQRNVSAHKGTSGEVFIIAGSLGMMGAAAMAARSALRVGAGLVRVGIPESLAVSFNSMVPEAIVIPLAQTKEGSISENALEKIIVFYKNSDAVAIGPGLSANKETMQVILDFIKKASKEGKGVPIVADADAINAISLDPAVMKVAKNLILTPHPGEMSRLVKMTVDEVQNKRVEVAKDLSLKSSSIVVLKGARTVVASPEGKILINLTGNPGMASAGMGDVLTGAIAGLLSQGLSAFDAASCGVFLHGMAGDVVSSLKGEHGISAGDLIEALPYVIKSTLQ